MINLFLYIVFVVFFMTIKFKKKSSFNHLMVSFIFLNISSALVYLITREIFRANGGPEEGSLYLLYFFLLFVAGADLLEHDEEYFDSDN